jgi:hypothetical protein
VDLGLLPCLAKRREVLARVSVQEELVLNDLEDVRGQFSGNLYFGSGFDRAPRVKTESASESRTSSL